MGTWTQKVTSNKSEFWDPFFFNWYTGVPLCNTNLEDENMEGGFCFFKLNVPVSRLENGWNIEEVNWINKIWKLEIFSQVRLVIVMDCHTQEKCGYICFPSSQLNTLDFVHYGLCHAQWDRWSKR